MAQALGKRDSSRPLEAGTTVLASNHYGTVHSFRPCDMHPVCSHVLL